MWWFHIISSQRLLLSHFNRMAFPQSSVKAQNPRLSLFGWEPKSYNSRPWMRTHQYSSSSERERKRETDRNYPTCAKHDGAMQWVEPEQLLSLQGEIGVNYCCYEEPEKNRRGGCEKTFQKCIYLFKNKIIMEGGGLSFFPDSLWSLQFLGWPEERSVKLRFVVYYCTAVHQLEWGK